MRRKKNCLSIRISFLDLEFNENQNKGFSQANNTGAKFAKGEYLLFLNADTEVCSDFLADLADSFKEKDFGAAGLKLYNTDNTFQLSFWKENTFFNEIRNKEEENKFRNRNIVYMNEKEKEYLEIKKVDWVTGASLFIRRNI
ncbi:MAG: glycosyltransferase [Ignavibacteria bacterium]|nr:glycosyltransferase [Ignavibacteria bacterium]